MYWGQPWTAPWGAPDNTVRHLAVQPLADGRSLALQFAAAAGFGDSWQQVYLQDRLAAHFFAPECVNVTVPVLLPAAIALQAAPVGFALYGVGGWACSPFSLRTVHLTATAADRGRRARLTWAAAPAFDAVHGDTAAQLSGWALTGVDRHRHVDRVADQPTRGRLYWTLIDTAGARTVTLFADAALLQPVATGSRSGDGLVTLTAVGDSGLTGAVTVAYTADVVAAAWIDLRWPARYDLFANAGAGAIEFDAPFAVIRDNGRDTACTWVSAELLAGSWDFCLRAVSDTGVAATNTAVQASLTVTLPPEPPGLPVYLSGDAATGLTFQFAPSPTVGATYRLYRSAAPDRTPDTSTPDAIAGSGASQIASTALTGGAGRYSFLLVAVAAAGPAAESLNVATVVVDLAADGSVVPPRPPAPHIDQLRIAGRDLAVRARFHSADAAAGAAAVTAVDFYLAAETAAIDWNAPAASAAPVAQLDGWQQAAADLPTAPADGWHQLAARCRTAAGDRDGNTAVRWVYLNAAAPAVVTPVAALIR